MDFSGSYAVSLLWITVREYQPGAGKLIFRNTVVLICFLKLIWLLGDIEPE